MKYKLIKYFNGKKTEEEVVTNVSLLNTDDCSKSDRPASGFEFTRVDGRRGYAWNGNDIQWFVEKIS